MLDTLPTSIGILSWRPAVEPVGLGPKQGVKAQGTEANHGTIDISRVSKERMTKEEATAIGRYFEPLLYKGSNIPAKGARVFNLGDSRQKFVSLDIYEEVHEVVAIKPAQQAREGDCGGDRISSEETTGDATAAGVAEIAGIATTSVGVGRVVARPVGTESIVEGSAEAAVTTITTTTTSSDSEIENGTVVVNSDRKQSNVQLLESVAHGNEFERATADVDVVGTTGPKGSTSKLTTFYHLVATYDFPVPLLQDFDTLPGHCQDSTGGVYAAVGQFWATLTKPVERSSRVRVSTHSPYNTYTHIPLAVPMHHLSPIYYFPIFLISLFSFHPLIAPITHFFQSFVFVY